jgi:hypothetical protein
MQYKATEEIDLLSRCRDLQRLSMIDGRFLTTIALMPVRCVVVIVGRLLHRAMAGLLLSFRERNAAIDRFGEIVSAEAIGGKPRRAQSSNRGALLNAFGWSAS